MLCVCFWPTTGWDVVWMEPCIIIMELGDKRACVKFGGCKGNGCE